MRFWAVLLVAVAIAAWPASAVAEPGYYVERPHRLAEFRLRGSNGYTVDVQATRGASFRRNQIYVTARKGPASVSYMVPGSLGTDNSITARLPHVGRIAVRFEPRKTEAGIPIDNCRGRTDVVERGYFRGTIQIRGEGGFTEVNRDSAGGSVTRTFHQVCDNEADDYVRAPKGKFTYTAVLAGKKQDGRDIRFAALETQLGSSTFDVSFSATATDRREGMHVLNSVNTFAGGKLVSSRPGEPKAAEVDPPGPFEGSATFHLTSPTTANWEGDLAVGIPGVGPVSLTGDGLWSGICNPSGCTKTIPKGVGFILFGGFG